MGIYLSERDLKGLRLAQERLLLMGDLGDVRSWGVAVLREVKTLLGCDITCLVLGSPAGLIGATEDFDPALFDRLPGLLSSGGDPDFQKMVMAGAAAGDAAWTADGHSRRVTGKPVAATQVFQEYMQPAGVEDGPTLQVTIPGGLAALAVAHSNASKNSNGFARELELLWLLAPALSCGARLHLVMGAAAASLATSFDQVDTAVVAIDPLTGRILRNRSLERLLDGDPQRECVIAEAGRLLERVKSGGAGFEPESRMRVRTGRGEYELHAGLISAGIMGSAMVPVATVTCASPRLPDLEHLRARWTLGAQEARVTLMLAEGLSNKEIAKRLGLRPATVRTHAERIFTKVGVHSRKALGLLLLGVEESGAGQ